MVALYMDLEAMVQEVAIVLICIYIDVGNGYRVINFDNDILLVVVSILKEVAIAFMCIYTYVGNEHSGVNYDNDDNTANND